MLRSVDVASASISLTMRCEVAGRPRCLATVDPQNVQPSRPSGQAGQAISIQRELHMQVAGIGCAALLATRQVRRRVALIEQGGGDAGLRQSVRDALVVCGSGKASSERCKEQ